MRLWHYKLIKYLPKSQLVAQWRELNSIFKKQDKHILINYVYDYPKEHLFDYTCAVINEMKNRNIKIKSLKNYIDYFNELNYFATIPYVLFKEHNDEYLTICYWNLREKYLRGQKDFTKDVWKNIDKFYKEEIRR